ncbi:MAG: beta-lactamase family protein [Woeseiaceae bacterium]|nr:beta-lactamase family protein [Woeseiaceae bacterium]
MENRTIAALLVSTMLFGGCAVENEDKVDKLFSDYSGIGMPGAAVLVVRDGQPVLTRVYGLADVASNVAITADTNFRLASLTKQFTAMCVLMLVDRGKLTLEHRITDVFADFPEYGRNVSIRNLLQHTSGLIDYEDFVPEDSPVQVTDSGVLDIMRQQDTLYFEPGTQYRYSNSGYAVLAMMVEKVSGQPFAGFLHANIFQPLGMNTTVAYQDGISVVSNRAYGYTVDESGVSGSDQSPWSAVLGDGGIYSSLNDLFKWDQALYTERLIPAGLFEQALTPNLEDYGFGWRIDDFHGYRRMHHSGSTSGFRNFIQRFPEQRLTVIALTNRRDPEVDPLAESVARLYLGSGEIRN